MPSHDRRAAARRRAWGRGPIILRFEPLEGRQLLAAGGLPDLVGKSFQTSVQSAQWGDSLEVSGTVLNQGKAAVSTPFDVQIIASSSPTIGTDSFVLGKFAIPAGLQAGDAATYDQQVTLPPTPIPGFAGKPIYISSNIAPGHAVRETNYRNNFSIGLNYDTAPLTIVQPKPSQLLGTSFALSTNASTWGQQVTISAQIVNNAQGNAPATRAAIVLTPAGLAPGQGQDVTIGYLNIPVVPAWQTVNLVQTFTLPATAPAALASSAQFTISMIQDADYLTNPMYPHMPTQGLGLDQAQIAIGPGPVSSVTPPPLPNLAAGSVQAPAQAIHWGQGFPVTASVQNVGQGVAAPFNVVFVLAGSDGSTASAIFLGETPVNGLAAGASQTINTNLLLPSRLPSGISLNSIGIGRIDMLIDPENVVSETVRSDNVSTSNPVTLRLLGADGTSTVPNAPAPAVTLGQLQPQGTLSATGIPAHASTPAQAAQMARAQAVEFRRLHLKATPKKETLAHKVEHRLKVFPGQVSDLFTNLFKK